MRESDNLSEDGARELARSISQYWFAQGKMVLTWVEPITVTSRTKVFGVRGSLVNGLPGAR
jgi:hypothetical protein